MLNESRRGLPLDETPQSESMYLTEWAIAQSQSHDILAAAKKNVAPSRIYALGVFTADYPECRHKTREDIGIGTLPYDFGKITERWFGNLGRNIAIGRRIGLPNDPQRPIERTLLDEYAKKPGIPSSEDLQELVGTIEPRIIPYLHLGKTLQQLAVDLGYNPDSHSEQPIRSIRNKMNFSEAQADYQIRNEEFEERIINNQYSAATLILFAQLLRRFPFLPLKTTDEQQPKHDEEIIEAFCTKIRISVTDELDVIKIGREQNQIAKQYLAEHGLKPEMLSTVLFSDIEKLNGILAPCVLLNYRTANIADNQARQLIMAS